MDERRKYQRFRLEEACIIDHDNTVGTVVDISMGGLSCFCLDQGVCGHGLSTRVNIYCKKYDLCAEDVTIKILATGIMPGEFMKDLGLRRCHVQFLQLDASQQAQLGNIIVRSSFS